MEDRNPTLSGDLCTHCHRPLTHDEVGLHRKLFNRAATEYMCITCIAEYLGVTEQLLDGKIGEFRAMGCTLFT